MNQKKKERKERKALQICFHKTITNIQFLETQRTRLLEKETKIWRQGSGGEKRQTQEPHTPVDTTHKGKGTAVAVAVASPLLLLLSLSLSLALDIPPICHCLPANLELQKPVAL